MEEKSFYYRYCIIIKNNYEKLCDYFIKILKENDFEVQSFIDNKKIFICISQHNEERMYKEAEKLRIKKIFNNNEKNKINKELNLSNEIIEIEKLKNFEFKKKNDYLPDKSYDELYENIKDKNERFGLDLFTEIEMLHIEKSILEHIIVKNKDELNNLFKEINNNNNFIIDELSIFNTLLINKIIFDHFPLNISNFSEKIALKCLYKFRFPYNLIRSYFNDQVGIYFAWFYHYTRYLIYPSIFYLIIFVLCFIFPNKIRKLLTIYSFFIIIWLNFFIIYWNRKKSELKIKWDNYSIEYEIENYNKNFVGEVNKLSQITEKYEPYYPEKKRLIKYLISFIYSISILFISVIINLICLNLQDLIKEDDKIFKIKFLNNLSKKNKPFEKGKMLNNFIGIIQPILIQLINNIYAKICVYTTEQENHLKMSNYNNSLIYKRFAFELLNNFFNIYYLAFIIRDLNNSSNSIKKILYTNEIGRIIGDLFIPLINRFLYDNTTFQKLSKGGDKNLFLLGKEIDQKEVIRQSNLGELNMYNEYLTIFLEFCYLTLFAECIPFAAILLLLVNFIELRSDIIKISTVIRRPEYIRKRSIGAWEIIFNIISFLSIFTNLTFSFLFNEENNNKFDNLFSFCKYEHIIFALILILRMSWPNTKEWVKLFLDRNEYKLKNLNR